MGEPMSKNDFPVGGNRQDVYDFLHSNGFIMSAWTDKHWWRADGVQLHLYGSGSKARISGSDGNILIDAPLSEAVEAITAKLR